MEIRLERLSLVAVVVVFGVLSLILVWNFKEAMLTSLVLSFLLYPLYGRINRRLKRPAVSSSIVVTIAVIGIVVPLTLLTTSLINQTSSLLVGGSFSLDNLNAVFDRFGINASASMDKITEKVTMAFEGWLPNIFSAVSDAFVQLFVIMFLMFYLFIDGKRVIEQVSKVLPLRKKYKQKVLHEAGNLTHALVIGQVLTALIQGFAGTIGFLLFGLPGAIFWGFIMAILSFIPMVGTALVWIPAGGLLLLNGQLGRGLGLLIWGFVVVGPIDNIVRPKLVSSRAHIHPATVLLGVLGGLSVFGIIGVVVGPLILAVFLLFLKMHTLSVHDR